MLALLLLCQWIDPPPVFETLSNGLRVIVVVDPSQPLVSGQLWFRAGGAHTPPALPDLAGDALRRIAGRGGADERLRAVGAEETLFALNDAIGLTAALVPEDLAHFLDVCLARLQPWSAQELSTPLGAVDGRDMRLARPRLTHEPGTPLTSIEDRFAQPPRSPAPLQRRALLNALLPDHPYARLASPSTAPPDDEAARAALLDFLQQGCGAGNATLLIVGDVNPTVVIDLARTKFGALPLHVPPRRAALEFPPDERVRLAPVAGGEGERCVEFAWLMPPYAALTGTSVEVLMHLLCDPRHGSLNAALSRQGARVADWSIDRWRQAGVLILTIRFDGASADAPAAVEQVLFDAFRAAAANPPEVVALRRARSQALTSLTRHRADFFRRALWLAEQEVLGGDLLLAEWQRARIESLPAIAVRDAAAWLAEARVAIAVGPIEPARTGPASTHRDLPAPAVWSGRTRPAAPQTASSAAELPADRVQRYDLGRGVALLVLPTADERCALRVVIRPRAGVWPTAHELADRLRSDPMSSNYAALHGIEWFEADADSRAALVAAAPSELAASLVELVARAAARPGSTEGAEPANAIGAIHWLAPRPSTVRFARRMPESDEPTLPGDRDAALMILTGAVNVAEVVESARETLAEPPGGPAGLAASSRPVVVRHLAQHAATGVTILVAPERLPRGLPRAAANRMLADWLLADGTASRQALEERMATGPSPAQLDALWRRAWVAARLSASSPIRQTEWLFEGGGPAPQVEPPFDGPTAWRVLQESGYFAGVRVLESD